MILFCGEALIDMVATPHGDAQCFVPRPGGAALNASLALARLGRASGLLAGLSTDMFGIDLRAILDADGVDTSLCKHSSRPTTLAFADISEGSARFAFMDENTAGRMIQQGELPCLPDHIVGLHFSGISLVAEPSGGAFESLAHREHGRRLIILDPNIRPALIADTGAHRRRMARMIRLADIVKVSDEDLDWMHESDPARWLREGASLVIHTHGARGATAFTAAHTVAVEAPRGISGNTIGAGDNFLAGVLAQLGRDGRLEAPRLKTIERHEVLQAISMGCRAAALRIAHPHGRAPSWREVREFEAH